MARTKKTATKTTTRKPRKAAPPKTAADSRPFKNLVLHADNLAGMSAGQISSMLSRIHAESPVTIVDRPSVSIATPETLGLVAGERAAKTTGGVQAASAKLESRMEYLTRMLESELTNLHLAINDHGTRLEPILFGTDDKHEPHDDRAEVAGDSPLARLLDMNISHLQYAISRLEDLTRRAQV